jgi:putative peptidoglycan lipid II flippase
MSRAAEFALALTLPAAVALVAMPDAIVGALFGRGAFTAEDVSATAAATAIYALGLPAYVLQKVVQPAYFAREDMDAPLRYALIAMGLNTAIAAAGAPLVGFLAIPAATVIAAWAQLWLLARGARAHGGARWDGRLRRASLRIAASALGMGAALWAVGGLDLMHDPATRLLALAAAVAGGAGLYAALVLATGALRVSDLKAALRRGRQAGAKT